MSSRPVRLFLANRPRYEREHVLAIEAHAREAGIPFCFECIDWHHPSEDHSTLG